MAPEHEARTRVLYDHESEEPGRRRRAVADWGVGEDIFDRMPSRRFTRAERRAEHSRTVVISRAAPADAAPHGESPAIVVETAPVEAPRPAAAGESSAPPDEPVSRMIAAPEARREPAPAAEVAPAARRTVVISGHPDGLPVARPRAAAADRDRAGRHEPGPDRGLRRRARASCSC